MAAGRLNHRRVADPALPTRPSGVRQPTRVVTTPGRPGPRDQASDGRRTRDQATEAAMIANPAARYQP